MKVDYSNCLPKCEGIDVISYNEIILKDNKKLVKKFSKISKIVLKSNFENDPELNQFISKLSDQYNEYKGSFKFPLDLKSKNKKFNLIFLTNLY